MTLFGNLKENFQYVSFHFAGTSSLHNIHSGARRWNMDKRGDSFDSFCHPRRSIEEKTTRVLTRIFLARKYNLITSWYKVLMWKKHVWNGDGMPFHHHLGNLVFPFRKKFTYLGVTDVWLEWAKYLNIGTDIIFQHY